ncbi:ring-cleaving dioxygenase, partial [Staphylococcus epidermidis]
ILLVNDDYQTPEQWSANDDTVIPKDVQILGMGPVELRSRKPEALTEFLEHILGYHQRNDLEADDNTTIMTLDEQGLYTD